MTGDRVRTGEWPIVPPGIWLDIRTSRGGALRPALFLDRDGVIVEDRGFISAPADVTLVAGAAALVRMANGARVPVLVVTNQSGIDRGRFGWDAFAAVEDRIAALLAAEGATLDAIAACPFHPDFTPGYGPAQARYRKPEAGMITRLSEALGIALSDSWMVGDQPRDMEAARKADLAGGVMVGDPEAAAAREAGSLSTSSFAVRCARSLTDAAQFLRTTRLFAHA